jgi:hypothetical protein
LKFKARNNSPIPKISLLKIPRTKMQEPNKSKIPIPNPSYCFFQFGYGLLGFGYLLVIVSWDLVLFPTQDDAI